MIRIVPSCGIRSNNVASGVKISYSPNGKISDHEYSTGLPAESVIDERQKGWTVEQRFSLIPYHPTVAHDMQNDAHGHFGNPCRRNPVTILAAAVLSTAVVEAKPVINSPVSNAWLWSSLS